ITTGNGVLLVHALNPYGFSNNLRVNADNVDLNRACLDKPQEFNLDDVASQGAVASYQRLLAPDRPREDELYERCLFALELCKITLKGKLPKAKNVIAGGQYSFPNSLFYGGRETPQEAAFFRDLIDEHSEGYRTMVVVDLHSGLGGKFGFSDGIFTHHGTKSGEFRRLRRVLPELQSVAEQHGALGVYKVKGSLIEYAERHSRTERTFGVVIDFHTYNMFTMIYRMIAENQIRCFNPADTSVRTRIERKFLEGFYPSNSKKRARILQSGSAKLEDILREFNLI
ncbi:DUF2817 domain-containing protein, partial [Candidatus Woesearchaeota archaeon]|nr:DUF2817 domain-containing protein [Candidatus Woesearchaeota archaeon]